MQERRNKKAVHPDHPPASQVDSKAKFFGNQTAIEIHTPLSRNRSPFDIKTVKIHKYFEYIEIVLCILNFTYKEQNIETSKQNFGTSDVHNYIFLFIRFY